MGHFFMFATTKVTAKVRSSRGVIHHTNHNFNANCLHLVKQHISTHDNCLYNCCCQVAGWWVGMVEKSPSTLYADCMFGESHNPLAARVFLLHTQGISWRGLQMSFWRPGLKALGWNPHGWSWEWQRSPLQPTGQRRAMGQLAWGEQHRDLPSEPCSQVLQAQWSQKLIRPEVTGES